MKLLNTLFVFIGFMAISACSTLAVDYDYNQNTDFTTYKNYDWMPFPKNMQVNPLNRSRFVTAVNVNLASKGLRQNPAKADLYIAAHFGKEEKVDLTSWGYTYAPEDIYLGYGYRHSIHSPALTSSYGISTYRYEEGTLILDFIDTKTKQLIWRATAKAVVSPESSPQKQTEKINDAVQEILSNFPPKQNNT